MYLVSSRCGESQRKHLVSAWYVRQKQRCLGFLQDPQAVPEKSRARRKRDRGSRRNPGATVGVMLSRYTHDGPQNRQARVAHSWWLGPWPNRAAQLLIDQVESYLRKDAPGGFSYGGVARRN